MDTSFIFALASKDDKYHESATDKLRSFNNSKNIQLITSDYVVDELLLLIMKYQSMENAIRWSKIIMDGKFCSIYYCNNIIFNSAINIFQSETDERKPLTLTDAIVYFSSKMLSCDEILTYDGRLKSYKSREVRNGTPESY